MLLRSSPSWTITTLSSRLGQLWPALNFLSRLKHIPLSFFNYISAFVRRRYEVDVGDCYPVVERTGVNVVDKAEGLLCGLIVIDLVVLPPLEEDENEEIPNPVLDDIDYPG
ncbi:unnamed protein product [Citrullus colocynthis]|uniref:Uncharacterized protein n=1 Tax=Citrullus colocynthis TaxID=252529 RepID=A0ABP0Z5Q9_9ROSI